MTEHLSITLALVAVLGMGAQWLAWRLRVPAIILLTFAGILAGPVFGWLKPSQDLGHLLQPLIGVGVAVILFEGGLSLRFHELRQAATGVKRLATVGVALSLALGSTAAHYVGGLSWPVALVFGAIIVVTGPTVIMPLLRQARLRRRPASYLKWEGIINDPTGALLAVLAFEYFVYTHEVGLMGMLPHVGAGLAVAAFLGVGSGYLLGSLFRRGHAAEYLKGPLALAAALGVYVLANRVLEESGLLAATILGITLGNMRLPSISELRRFKEYMAIILVSGVFILLTAELKPVILLDLDWRSVALLLLILLVIRPVTIYLSTLGAGMTWQERALLAWIAPRGVVAAAVAGVFAPQLQQQGYGGASLLLPLVFALILITVISHGLTIGWLARRLGLSAAGSHGVLIVGSSSWTIGLAQALKDREVSVMIVDASWHRLRAARLAGIQVFYGEILSELSEQTLEFSDIGYLFAATDNDAYNSLVCTHFAAELGRNRVFQLPYPDADETDIRQPARSVRGMIAPSEKAVFEELLANWYRGWTFQKTHLTESFSYADWLATCPEDSLAVAVVAEDGAVRFNAAESPVKPKVGEVLISYGPKQEKAKNEKKAGRSDEARSPTET